MKLQGFQNRRLWECQTNISTGNSICSTHDCNQEFVRVSCSKNLRDFENYEKGCCLLRRNIIPPCEVALFTRFEDRISKNFLHICVTFLHWHRKAKNQEILQQADLGIFRCFCGVYLSILLRFKNSFEYWHSAMVCSLIHKETFHMKLWKHYSQSEATDNSVKLLLAYKDLTDCRSHFIYA